MTKEHSYAVLGLGRYGCRIVDIVSSTGVNVVVADSDKQIIGKYAPKVTMAMTADLADPAAVKQLPLEDVDIAVIDLANNLEAAIMCVMIAKEKGVEQVIAKAGTHRMGTVLTKVGADTLVFPEEESAERMARMLISEDFMEMIPLTDEICVLKMTPLKEWTDKPLNRLELRRRFHVNLLGIERDGIYSTDFTADTVLKKEENVMVLTEKKYIFDLI